MTINERVKILRKELKLSQTEFAEKLSVSRDVINNIENIILDIYSMDFNGFK